MWSQSGSGPGLHTQPPEAEAVTVDSGLDQTKLWSLWPRPQPLHQPLVARWAQCHIQPGVWPVDSWHHPSWHGGQPSVTSVTRHRPGCDVWRGYVMWHHVTCDDEEWLSAYVNQRETSPSHCLKMSHYNGSKVYNIPLFQSLEPYNDILEEFLPSADIDTGRTLLFNFHSAH